MVRSLLLALLLVPGCHGCETSAPLGEPAPPQPTDGRPGSRAPLDPLAVPAPPETATPPPAAAIAPAPDAAPAAGTEGIADREAELRRAAESGGAEAAFALGMFLHRQLMDDIGGPDAAEAAALAPDGRASAIARITEVADLFRDVVAEYLPRHVAAKDPDTGEVDAARFGARQEQSLLLAWTYRSELLFARGRLRRQPNLEREDYRAAADVASAFVWEFDGRLVAWWVLLTRARCRAALGKTDGAVGDCLAVLAVPQQPAARGVRLMAYWRLAEVLAGADRTSEVTALAGKLEADYPDFLKDYAGQACWLEVARAQAARNERDEARAAAGRLLEVRPAFFAEAARRLLDRLR